MQLIRLADAVQYVLMPLNAAMLWASHLSTPERRKLSGAFLACIKLRARVPCRQLFFDAFDRHDWGGAAKTAEPERQAA